MSRKWCNLLGVLLLAMVVCGQAVAGQAGSVQETGSGQAEVTQPAVTPHPAVEPIVSMREPPAKDMQDTKAPQRKRSYNFSLTGTAWLDTGVLVAAGDTAALTPTGS